MSGIRECSQNLLLKREGRAEGYTKVVGRGEMGLKHLEFGLLRLTEGEWSGQTGACEQGLNIYSGTVSLDTGSSLHAELGGRETPFHGLPTVIYLPPNTDYRIGVARGPVEIGVFSASAPGFAGEPAVISPEDVIRASVGKDNWRRDIYTAIGENIHAAKIVLGETVVPPGNWSSAPPHKHDALKPMDEVPLEEVCYFQVNPPQGFGIIRVYTAANDPGPMDETYVIENGDTVIIPRGYHPLAAAPGYTISYTWAMAGDLRVPGAVSFDPRHEWVMSI